MHFVLAAIGSAFIPRWDELRPFMADLWLISAIVGVLIPPFFSRRSNTTCTLVTLGGLGMAMLSLLCTGIGDQVTSSHLRGMLLSDPFAICWKAILLMFVMGTVVLWWSTTAETMLEADGPEFCVQLLGATLGLSLMASTANLLMLFIAVELASMPSYVLAGFRKTYRTGAEASLKYVLFGAVTAAILAYGLSILYGLYGTLQIDGAGGLAEKLANGQGLNPAMLSVAFIGVLIGLGFKVSAVPFHFWAPDVFEGASVDVSAFLSVASKGAGLVLLLRVLMLLADAIGYHSSPGISLVVIAMTMGILGTLTATLGNTAALRQSNIKRLLAYSSIAHAGYMLCLLSLLINRHTLITDNTTNLPATALLIYLVTYLFMNLGAFTVAGLVYQHSGSEDLSAFRSLGRRSPILAACMAACLISLVGLPPLGGFTAKVYLLWALMQNGGWWWALVGVVAVNTIISLYVYFRVIRTMYIDASDEPAFSPPHPATGVAIACSVMLVALFVGFGELAKLAQRYARLHGVDGMVSVTSNVPASTPQAFDHEQQNMALP